MTNQDVRPDQTELPRLQVNQRPPAPSSISPQAQAFLEVFPPYVEPVTPDLDDTAGWLRHIEAGDERIRAMFLGAAPEGLDRTLIDDGVPIHVLAPAELPDPDTATLFLEIHGGGLTLGGGDLCWQMASRSAVERPGVTWVPDYRMPPLHPYPHPLDDCMTAYRKALEVRSPDQIVVTGGSAGGNLAAAMLLRAKDEGLPMPAVLVLGTPELDLTESGDTFQTLNGVDFLTSLMGANLLYAAGEDLSHPYLSPLFGDVAGFPPTLLRSGTRDLYLSNTVRMHRKLLAAGVPTELHVLEAAPHGGFGGTSPEDIEFTEYAQRFVARHLHGSA